MFEPDDIVFCKKKTYLKLLDNVTNCKKNPKCSWQGSWKLCFKFATIFKE